MVDNPSVDCLFGDTFILAALPRSVRCRVVGLGDPGAAIRWVDAVPDVETLSDCLEIVAPLRLVCNGSDDGIRRCREAERHDAVR